MGHERLGALPKTQRWRDVVHRLPVAAESQANTTRLAATTLQNVRDRYSNMAQEEGVLRSFKFLLGVAVAARGNTQRASVSNELGISLPEEPTPVELTKALQRWIIKGDPGSERTVLASKAAADALAIYQQQPAQTQEAMFSDTPWDAWRSAGTGAGFCELSRHFFARLTERYLRYYLDREASASVNSASALDQLRDNLHSSIDEVSKHAFETAKITQSFAAGWFNRHATETVPDEATVRGFLSHALEKIREELRREAQP